MFFLLRVGSGALSLYIYIYTHTTTSASKVVHVAIGSYLVLIYQTGAPLRTKDDTIKGPLLQQIT